MAKFLLPKLTDLLKQRKIEMSTIYDRIKSDITNALKAKDLTKANTLRYVKGILDNNATSAKPVLPTDDNIIAYLTGYIRDLKGTLESAKTKGKDDTVAALIVEIDVLNAYLPKQLTTEEIDTICAEQNFASIKDAMSYFKDNYFKQYDAKYVSAKYK